MGEYSVVKVLVEEVGEDLNITDRWSQNSLHYAAQREHEATIDWLLKNKDVEADTPMKNGCAPLYTAVRDGHAMVAKQLSEIPNVDVHRTYRLPLHLAVLHLAVVLGATGIVSMLIDRHDLRINAQD